MAVYVVMCGMIWDHPGMLRLVRLYCVLTLLYGGGKRQDGYYVGRGEKMLCWATKAKKCPIHYFLSKLDTAGAARRAGSRWRRSEQWLVSRGHCEHLVQSRTFSSILFQAFFSREMYIRKMAGQATLLALSDIQSFHMNVEFECCLTGLSF